MKNLNLIVAAFWGLASQQVVTVMPPVSPIK